MTRKGFWARFFSDWPAKVFSLAAALLLFGFYRLNRLENRFLSVPLAVTLNGEYLPGSQLPRSVRLTLRGESNALFSILDEDLKAVVDLSAFRSEGLARAAVLVEKKGSALGVDPLEIQIEPAEIAVNLEKKVSRIVPITPAFRGYLDPGYELVSFEFQPPEVEIAGPASAVARTVDLSTDFIELSGRKADFSAEVRLQRKESLVLIAGPETVQFRAVVQAAIAYQSFDAVEIAVEGLAEGLELAEPLPFGSLRLQATRAELRDYVLPPGSLYLDLTEIRRPGTYTLPLSVRLPEGFALDSLEPRSLSLRLQARTGARP